MTNDVAALEREIEQTRDRLADTLDQLLYRAHPKTIVSREVTAVKAHFVDPATGAPRTDNIIKAAGSSSKVLHAPERAGDVKHSRACADKLRNAGWQPRHTLPEGLATTLEYFKGILGR